MNIFGRIKGWFNTLFSKDIKDNFQIEPIESPEMDLFLTRCARIYAGKPDWIDENNHVKTVNFAKAVCSETAKLTTLDIDIKITGSARADYIKKQTDKYLRVVRQWVEYAAAHGMVIAKPNGKDIDIVMPDSFKIISTECDQIKSIVFLDRQRDPREEVYFTRYEWHRFDENGVYLVSNKCYKGKSVNDKGKPIAIEETPWANLQEEIAITGLEKPLFGVLKMPAANNIDPSSPLGMPVFADAIEELKDLDIAYSRNVKEIDDSKRITLIDSDRLTLGGKPVTDIERANRNIDRYNLPDFVRIVQGDGSNDIYHEINPTLNTETRINGINSLLSQIGYKCGFSNGHFVFNERTGFATATQIESEDQRTIQTIKDIRDCLEVCIDGLIYALDKFADLYDLAPVGTYETVYSFRDLTYNYEEDKQRWYSYVLAGHVPFWKYAEKFEGMTVDDAKELQAEAMPKGLLFGGAEE